LHYQECEKLDWSWQPNFYELQVVLLISGYVQRIRTVTGKNST